MNKLLCALACIVVLVLLAIAPPSAQGEVSTTQRPTLEPTETPTPAGQVYFPVVEK